MAMRYFTNIEKLIDEPYYLSFYKNAFVPVQKDKNLKNCIFDYSEYCLKNDIKIDTTNSNVLEFIDKKEYVYIVVNKAIFHFFVDNLQAIIYHYRYNKDAKFILNLIDVGQYAPQFIELFERLFNYLRIDYCFVDTSNTCLVFKNVFYYSFFPFMQITLLDLIKTLKDCYKIDYSIVPNKKIYVSRKRIDTEDLQLKDFENNKKIFNNQFSQYSNDIRLENAEKFENFLIDNSFSIIIFEDLTWEQRFNLLNETKLISGVSGSGVMGCLFMQECQTVIEYKTMLRGWPDYGNENLHQHYEGMAYIKKHLYLSIYNDRNPDNLIKIIKNNKMLMGLINE